MKDEISQRQLRTVQYQHIDGSFELTFGGSLSLMAISYLVINKVLLTNPRLSDLLAWGPLVVFVLGGFLIDRLVNMLRTHTTYPRTGYISPRRPAELNHTTRVIIWIGVPLLSILLLIFLFLNRTRFPAQNPGDILNLMPFFFGILLSGMWVIIGWKISLPRFYVIAMVSFAASLVLFLRGVGSWPGLAWLFGITGLSLFLSGGITLWQYLRQYPAQQELPDEQ